MMTIGGFAVEFMAHVFFRFRSPGGRVLLTDPLYAEKFFFEGHGERYLSPPAVPVESLRQADAVFVSHLHGDHCDTGTLLAIQRQTGARIVGPPEVLETLRDKGAAAGALDEAWEGRALTWGDLTLRTLAGYDRSRDGKGRENKFSAVIESGDTRLFYAGDCNNVPPAAKGLAVEAVFFWPHPKGDKVAAICQSFSCRRLVLMHGDRFEPGQFFCNYDLAREKERLQPFLPGWEIIVPPREGPPAEGKSKS